ncbi:ring finger domain containing protein [Nitzschia inconspicua]|uniref:RING-type E3 ubiquitin transferase n=1 Tax=Nitzschia inconspicua TaxID=303405 RepID=A0A9K3L076_9STRA|nr:ring finger domain containing protein [Nitzschia inconspicua]
MEEPEALPETSSSYNNNKNHEASDAKSEEEIERFVEEAMEQMLLAQENEETEEEEQWQAMVDDETNPLMEQEERHDDHEMLLNDDDNGLHDDLNFHPHHTKDHPISYVKASFLAAFVLVFYAFRSRQQWYLALIFLSSSKYAYIILGNALIASLIGIFQLFTGIFMNGLRLAEAEGLGDFFRWNVTETCLALTIFRAELTVKTAILFLIMVLSKCLHWVADMREGHLRMTEEAVVTQPNSSWPALRWPHVKLLLCLYFLQLLDICAVIQCGYDISQHGPSVSILFAFEAAIMLTSVVSNVLLWHLHLFDGIFHFIHEQTDPARPMHRWIHPWKDYKATLVFAVEVQAQAAKFFFYVTFFAIVMTYYGLPINLIREVYISFQALKQRLVAFKTYRQLMASMSRFQSPTAEELKEEHTCIICRDEMTVDTSKRLPGCGHIMHKSCLREWLVQQQTCPTCRGDISVMEARQRQQDEMNAANQAQDPQEEDVSPGLNEGQNNDDNNGDGLGATESQNEPDSTCVDESKTKCNKGPSDAQEDESPKSSFREKRVRIFTPDSENGPSFNGSMSSSSHDIFPAFYRVVQDAGADVYSDGCANSFVIRVVPCGFIVLGQEISWRNCDGESKMMVRIPDGWVSDTHLERIVAVPLES